MNKTSYFQYEGYSAQLKLVTKYIKLVEKYKTCYVIYQTC